MKNAYYLAALLAVLLFAGCGKEKTPGDEQADTSLITHSPSDAYNWDAYNTPGYFGEVVFVPVYSSIFHQSDRTYDLTATLTVHNIDLTSPMKILSVDYYDTDGKLIRKFTGSEIELSPLQSRQFIIKESDISGGTAAKFVVQWVAGSEIARPVIESVMISTSSQQGISFKTESKVISSLGYK